jgi:hypothetical protein
VTAVSATFPDAGSRRAASRSDNPSGELDRSRNNCASGSSGFGSFPAELSSRNAGADLPPVSFGLIGPWRCSAAAFVLTGHSAARCGVRTPGFREDR